MGENMKIQTKKFGEFLMSRPAGLEAGRIICQNFVPKNVNEIFELDFEGVKAAGPSWIHEVCITIRQNYPNKIVVLDAGNASVIASLKVIDLENL
jgi:hypothetical protein